MRKIEVIDFSERCNFCGRKTDKDKLKNTYFGKEQFKACSTCRTAIQDNDNEYFIQRRKEIKRTQAEIDRGIREYNKRAKARRRLMNPHTNKKYCKLCNFWMNKSNWKTHGVTKRHAKNLFAQMEKAKV